ncbi:MAG: Uma2 family endonuclease [Planctomycetaceae bacterium]
MSTVLETRLPTAVPPETAARLRPRGINLADEAFIPAGITDLASFRRWADSELYPTRGKFSFLQGQLWVDLNLEQLFTHNQVKTKLTATLSQFVDANNNGYLFSDGVRLSHDAADLSAEPDAVFVSFAAIQQGKVKLVRGQLGGYVELEGSPELVVEIVSPSSVRKDTEVLRELYALAGVAEYWLIDARSTSPTLEILWLAENGYQSVPATERGLPSAALARRGVDSGNRPAGTSAVCFPNVAELKTAT